MAMNFLEFEQPIAELEAKIEELKFLSSDASVNISEEVKRLQQKSRALDHQHIFESLAVADHAAGASSAATLHARLRVDDFHRLAGVARRSYVQRRFGHRRRPGASRRAAGDGDRSPEGTRHQGASAAQLRHAETRRLPQGAAPDAHGRALSNSAHHADRHARRLSGHRLRGARTERGHCAESVRDVEFGGADTFAWSSARAGRAARSPSACATDWSCCSSACTP